MIDPQRERLVAYLKEQILLSGNPEYVASHEDERLAQSYAEWYVQRLPLVVGNAFYRLFGELDECREG